jgi:hypothetical protein
MCPLKPCTKCGKIKPLSEFYKDANKKSGYRAQCKACQNLAYSKWATENPDKLRASHEKWYSQNRERKLAANAKRYRKNIELSRERSRVRHRTIRSRWTMGKSIARRRGLNFDITFEEYTALMERPCSYCLNVFSSPIGTGVGLDRIDNTKGYTPNNVLPCCGFCNRLRGNQLSVQETCAVVNALLDFRSKP